MDLCSGSLRTTFQTSERMSDLVFHSPCPNNINCLQKGRSVISLLQSTFIARIDHPIWLNVYVHREGHFWRPQLEEDQETKAEVVPGDEDVKRDQSQEEHSSVCLGRYVCKHRFRAQSGMVEGKAMHETRSIFEKAGTCRTLFSQ